MTQKYKSIAVVLRKEEAEVFKAIAEFEGYTTNRFLKMLVEKTLVQPILNPFTKIPVKINLAAGSLTQAGDYLFKVIEAKDYSVEYVRAKTQGLRFKVLEHPYTPKLKIILYKNNPYKEDKND